MAEAAFALEDLVVRVIAPADALRFFGFFYDRHAGGHAGSAAAVELRVGADVADLPVDAVISRDSARVACVRRADREWLLVATEGSLADVLEAARCFVRQLWLGWRLSTSPSLRVHASSVDTGTDLVVFVGDKFGGKTTLLLDAVLRHHVWPVSNDLLFAFVDDGEVRFVPWPTYFRVRADTARSHAGTFERPDVVDASYGRDDLRHVLRIDDALFIPPAMLGEHRRMPEIGAASRRVTVAAIDFAAAGEAASVTTADSQDLAAFLLANRHDDATDEVVPWQLLPWRPQASAGVDAVAEAVARTASFVRFRHGGSCAPLLEAVAESRMP